MESFLEERKEERMTAKAREDKDGERNTGHWDMLFKKIKKGEKTMRGGEAHHGLRTNKEKL